MSALTREQARELQRLHAAVDGRSMVPTVASSAAASRSTGARQASELPLAPETVGVDRAELGGRAVWLALEGKGLVRIDRQAGPRGGDRWVLHVTAAGVDRVAAIRHYRARATA